MKSENTNQCGSEDEKTGPVKPPPSIDVLQYSFIMTKDHISITEVKDIESFVEVFRKGYEEAQRRARELT